MPNEIYHRSHWGNANAEGFGDVYFDASATNKLYKHSDNYENSDGTDKILRDIPNKASIVLTPTAYSDGSLNTVIPPYQVLPQELVTNGNFDTDSDWNKDDSWSISGGKANYDYISGRNLNSSTTTLIVGKTYQIEYTISNYISGSVENSSAETQISNNSNGTYTEVFTARYTFLRFRGSTNGEFSIDNVSVKEIQEADFDFSRGSSATRVNEQGLIEDVQILSGELVQNGNFEQIGSELVTNGNFDTDTDWTKGTGWTIADGSASYDASGTSALTSASTSIVSGKIYRLKFKITTSGFARLNFTTDGSQSLFQPNGNSLNNFADGEYTFYLSAQNNSTALKIFAYNVSGGTSFSIDNISVKEVGQNWSFGTGWSMGDGVASRTAQSSSSLLNASSITLTVGKTYKCTMTVSNYSDGLVRFATDNVGFTTYTSNGTFVEYLVATGTAFNIKGNSDFTGSVDNISVVEVTNDTDLPRIDYTSGFGSWLLEPQSTNLITYSEDFSEWSLGANATLTFVSDIEAPDGSLGVYRLQLPATNDTFISSNSFAGQNPLALSIYAKSVNTNNDFNLYNGSASSPIKTATDKWQRFDYIGNGNQFYIVNSGDTFITDIYIWGAQAEALSYATSYIVSNSGSTTTRSADVANNSGNADLFNDSEGVLYAEIAALNDDTQQQIGIYGNSISKQIRLEITNSVIRGALFNGAFQAILSSTQTVTDFNKIAFKYKENDFALWVNGIEVATDSVGLTFPANDLDRVNLTSQGGSSLSAQANVKSVAVFKEALTDAELQALTT